MLVDAKFMPRAYLWRFRSLQELAVDMFDCETAEDTDLEDLVQEHARLSMFYCVAPSALIEPAEGIGETFCRGGAYVTVRPPK